MKKTNIFLAIIAMVLALSFIGAPCSSGDNNKENVWPSPGGDSDGDADAAADGDSDGDGDGGKIDGVPDGVNDFMDQSDLDGLKNAGMVVHIGNNPPDITGTYYADTRYTQYDDQGYIQAFVNATYKFYNQTSDGLVDMQQTEEGVAEGTGIGSFISGESDCFTVWQDYKDHSTYNGDDCYSNSAVLVSGCLTTEGITEFQYGLIMKSRSGTCNYVVAEGYKRIIYETDGLVARTTSTDAGN